MAKPTVLAELLKVTGEKAPAKDEDLKSFVLRICTAMADDKVTDDMFKSLSPEAKKWYDENLERYEADKFTELTALLGMPGFEAVPARAETPATETGGTAAKKDSKPAAQPKENDVAKKKPGTKAAKPKKAAAPKSAAKPKEKAERKPRTDSNTYKIRMAVVKKPDIAFDAVVKSLGLKGKEASPASHAFNTFQHARSVIALYNEHGK